MARGPLWRDQELRVACRASQARLSSGWPIQIAKLWLIQLPAKSRCKRVGRRMVAEEFADRDRAGSAGRATPLVKRAEERDAAVGVVLPAVLAVEDHRDERRRSCAGRRRRSRASLPRKSAAAGRARAALIVEADLVGHRMVAEDDRQLVARLAHLPGAIEQLGMADVPPAVAADLAVGRAAEDLLVGGDPLDAVLGQQRDHLLADRAFARPHAPRSLAEDGWTWLSTASRT